jgi:hypothetical protein
LVKSRFSEQHSIQQAKYRDNLNDVVNYKYAHGGSLKGVDPVKWGMLDAKDRDDLTRPEAQETDLNTWYKFVTQPESLTLANVNEAFNKGLLTKGDFKNFTEAAVRMQNKPDYVQEAGGVSERINYFAGAAGLPVYDGQPKSPEQKQQIGVLHYKVQNEIDRIKAQNHGKITSEQVDQVIKRELTQQTLTKPGWFWNTTVKKYGFELPQGAAGQVRNKVDGKMHWTDATGKIDLGVAE